MKSNVVGKLIAAASALLLGSAWADNLPAEYAATSNFKMGALYGGAKYDGSTWADREMWQGDDVEIDLQLEGESGNTFAFIPVTGTGVLEPVVIGDLPKKHIASVKVWTDQEMFDTFTPKGVSPSKWEDDDEGWVYGQARPLHRHKPVVRPLQRPRLRRIGVSPVGIAVLSANRQGKHK